MDLGLDGKWALVCGASRGLGYGCAQALVAEGVNVVIVARAADALAHAAQKLRTQTPWVKVIPVAADITTPQGREAAWGAIGGPGQDIDILVTNAGGPPPGDFREWDSAIWHKALEANMLTPIELIRTCVDGMATRGFGRVVNITSAAVKAPIDILGLSNGARSGLTGFVAGLARGRLAGMGVTLNNLLPGKFSTERLEVTLAAAAVRSGQTLEAVRRSQQSQIPARRFGTPEEFGAVCAFLCSQQAAYLTGQNILLDGGAYPGTF